MFLLFVFTFFLFVFYSCSILWFFKFCFSSFYNIFYNINYSIKNKISREINNLGKGEVLVYQRIIDCTLNERFPCIQWLINCSGADNDLKTLLLCKFSAKKILRRFLSKSASKIVICETSPFLWYFHRNGWFLAKMAEFLGSSHLGPWSFNRLSVAYIH